MRVTFDRIWGKIRTSHTHITHHTLTSSYYFVLFFLRSQSTYPHVLNQFFKWQAAYVSSVEKLSTFALVAVQVGDEDMLAFGVLALSAESSFENSMGFQQISYIYLGVGEECVDHDILANYVDWDYKSMDGEHYFHVNLLFNMLWSAYRPPSICIRSDFPFPCMLFPPPSTHIPSCNLSVWVWTMPSCKIFSMEISRYFRRNYSYTVTNRSNGVWVFGILAFMQCLGRNSITTICVVQTRQQFARVFVFPKIGWTADVAMLMHHSCIVQCYLLHHRHSTKRMCNITSIISLSNVIQRWAVFIVQSERIQV